MRDASQLQIIYDPAVDPAATACPADVEQVMAILSADGQLTAAQICEKLGRPPTENNKRRIRATARASFPYILSFSISRDGAPRLEGYKLLRQCSIEEAWMAVNALSTAERDIIKKKKLLLDEIHTGRVGKGAP